MNIAIASDSSCVRKNLSSTTQVHMHTTTHIPETYTEENATAKASELQTKKRKRKQSVVEIRC